MGKPNIRATSRHLEQIDILALIMRRNQLSQRNPCGHVGFETPIGIDLVRLGLANAKGKRCGRPQASPYHVRQGTFPNKTR